MKKCKILCGVILACVYIVFGGLFLCSCMEDIEGKWYITDNIDDYGRIRGNGHNERPEEFLMSFFPEKIESNYNVIEYVYKAKNWCDYNCEMYLEFTISDPAEFQTCVNDLTGNLVGEVFAYDPRYTDFVVNNHLYVRPEPLLRPNEDEEYYFLENGARMGRILVCEEDQRIICVGIMVSGCCGGYSDDYDFYNRFGINPQEYSDQFCNDMVFG